MSAGKSQPQFRRSTQRSRGRCLWWMGDHLPRVRSVRR